MNKNDCIIRPERKEEQRATENLVREAFWNVYRPGCLEHYVLNQQRKFCDFVSELNFVMEKDGRLVGHNVFVRAKVKTDDGRTIPVLAMGPICILPEFQGRGFGKKLLDYSLEKARQMGFGAVCLEGNIDFYGKSGFALASGFGIRYHAVPEDMDSPFFLCRELIPGYFDGVRGEYTPPQCYFVSEGEVEEFDRLFPRKEKLKLEGQLF